ncbi:MAG TPA: ABC transporter permease subunit [Gaiellaceae bacterium]|nr:ABC transporter permease subunit [Gaiellaceae bacterium]
MTSVHHAADEVALATPRTARRRPRVPGATGNWWRHLVAIAAIAFALFPVAYILSASVNADQSLSGASLIPRDVTLDNFRVILSGEVTTTGGTSQTPYLRWYANTMIVAGLTALFTILLGALAAYAFSRFRFRGRRLGLLFLLLIQMFPQFLALVAIYLIVLRAGDVFPVLGLNTLTALIVVYLGGALGLNVWLMKGFFDTIPAELDESARVDGATPAQVFWGVVLPLAAPVLAVIGLISFVTTLNEFVIASVLLQTTEHFTLPVGMRGFIDKEYAERWGPFAAGVMLAAVPAALLFAFLQKFIVQGLTQGSVKG